MNKRYIRQFLSLTEQNILGRQLSANDNFEGMKAHVSSHAQRGFMQRLRICCIAIIAGLVAASFVKPYQQPITHPLKHVDLQHVTRTTSSSIQQISSVIPFYRENAKRQYLQPISLRKADIAIVTEPSQYQQVQVEAMVDKVIVAPKSFG